MRVLSFVVIAAAAAATPMAQAPRAIPRPPAQAPNAPPDGSAAPDGYAPLPAVARPDPRAAAGAQRSVSRWKRWPVGSPAPSRSTSCPTAASSSASARAASASSARTASRSAPLAGLPAIWNRGPQGLFEVLPDRDFARNRVLYLTYTALPEGTDASNPPRLAGVLMVARARLSDDSTRLEDVKTLLNAEGIGGRAIQAQRRHAARVVEHSRRRGHQLGGLAAAAAARQPDGQDPAHQPRRIDPQGQPVRRPRRTRGPRSTRSGIRDDQGMALHPRTGALWVSEHGPRGGDEINAIEKGKNYGFPAIGYGHEYTGKPIHARPHVGAGDGAAGLLLDAGHRAGGDRVLLGAPRSRLARQPVRVRARRQAPGAPGARKATASWPRSVCSPSSTRGCATCTRGPTARST